METEDESCINECVFRDGSKELFVIQNIVIQRCSMERKDNFYSTVYKIFEKQSFHCDTQ